MKKIEDGAAFFFVTAVSILSLISILGIWKIFDSDVISKSFQTLGLLALVAIIVMVAGKFMESRSAQVEGVVSDVPNPTFKSIRRMTVGILITSVSFLAILGVLAIWDVIADKDVLYKALGSVGVLAFSSFIIVVTSLHREGNPHFDGKGKSISGGTIALIIFLLYILFSFFGRFWF